MPVSKNDRDAYDEGRRDSEKGVFEQAVIDISGNHSDRDTYYKGRDHEQLDGDKKDK